MEPILLIHGGAGDIPDSRNEGKIQGLRKSMEIGFKILKEGGSALDAVEQAVIYMEDDANFNAGYGSVLNLSGEVEMDASIMEGSTLNAGGVTVVKDIKHPISLARIVMEQTPHVLLAAEGASKFAKSLGFPTTDPRSLVSPDAKKALEEFRRKGGDLTEIGHKNPGDVGTVGAVALDCQGNLAAATSTGGINGKMVGRCSDTSLIGSGTYADNDFGAVSTTGHGDTIIKYCLAIAIIKDIENGKSAQAATENNLKRMTKRLNNTAGAITLSKNGEPGIYFTSKKMAWMYQKGNELHYGINANEHKTEILK
ncbi:unnamed protein product [Diabrotica balteata]|uniref:Uncharacterized protein n=1 Tax=Diabrotica balteata TaxID=107213 RepID=A0A9N9T984_DIABA|nr:unnamed protein product [Diabrotica balteata]